MIKKKVVFIAPALLPIPSIKGGGIEQLMNNLIKQNELNLDIDILVISAYNKEAEKLQKSYKYTEFKNIKYTIFSRIINFIDRNIFSQLFNYPHYHLGIHQILRIILNAKFDRLVNFSNDVYIKPISTIVPKSKIVHYDASLLVGHINDFDLCDRILVGSQHSKDTYLTAAKFLTDERIKIIQSGIDIKFFRDFKNSKLRIDMRQELGIDDSIPVLCFLGRLVESKGIVTLLQALKLLPKDLFFKFICIGGFGSSFGMNINKKKSIEELTIRKLVEDLGEKCILTGYLNEIELERYLSVIDIGIVPTLDEEVSPLVYFQYQAMGITSIVSDSGGIPNYYSSTHSIMVKRGPNMVEELALSIEFLINNPALIKQMGAQATVNREYLGIERYYNDFVAAVF